MRRKTNLNSIWNAFVKVAISNSPAFTKKKLYMLMGGIIGPIFTGGLGLILITSLNLALPIAIPLAIFLLVLGVTAGTFTGSLAVKNKKPDDLVDLSLETLIRKDKNKMFRGFILSISLAINTALLASAGHASISLIAFLSMTTLPLGITLMLTAIFLHNRSHKAYTGAAIGASLGIIAVALVGTAIATNLIFIPILAAAAVAVLGMGVGYLLEKKIGSTNLPLETEPALSAKTSNASAPLLSPGLASRYKNYGSTAPLITTTATSSLESPSSLFDELNSARQNSSTTRPARR